MIRWTAALTLAEYGRANSRPIVSILVDVSHRVKETPREKGESSGGTRLKTYKLLGFFSLYCAGFFCWPLEFGSLYDLAVTIDRV
jgi:hypothetical protein